MRKKNFSNFHIYDVITKHNKQINKNNRISNNLNWTIYVKKKQKQKISIREKKNQTKHKSDAKKFSSDFPSPTHTNFPRKKMMTKNNENKWLTALPHVFTVEPHYFYCVP
jgi:predicted RNA-binding protein with RPS1 domain